ncbi:MAG: hypothetical protein VB878_11110 [Pirellulaceae bacterium]
MSRFAALLFATVLFSGVLVENTEAAWPRKDTANRWGRAHTMTTPWNGPYYHINYGRPVALVVPPTVTSSTHLGWGVTGTETRPIYSQFSRGGPGTVNRARLRGTPPWPQHTDQFGIYYVRGPWSK